MRRVPASVTVFGTSAAVLVVEIIAGRLMAPYVGISLETFTGIIGTMLAGIAAGAAVGGWMADRWDPRHMVGPAVVAGGALCWLSLPVLSGLGPLVGTGPVAIVTLTGAAFFLPVAVLSAVSPMVAALRLDRLDHTGSVVGGLSAAGTFGALVGTFLTGFVLVVALPSRVVVLLVGAVLVVVGAALWWRLAGSRPDLPTAGAVLVCLVLGQAASTPCDHETAYYCVRIERQPSDPSVRDLYLDRLRHASVDLDDPTALDIRYVRLLAAAAGSLPPGPLDTFHVGGGGFTLPRYLQAVRPGSTDLVVEIDGQLVDIAEDELGLDVGDGLDVEVGDGRLALADQGTDTLDLVIGDAFGSQSVPWHLTTIEFAEEIDRALRPEGLYAMNVLDGGDVRFARAQIATLQAVFDHVAMVEPTGGVPRRIQANLVLVASDAPLAPLDLDPEDGRLVEGADLEELVDGADPLTDDHAPVDQLLGP